MEDVIVTQQPKPRSYVAAVDHFKKMSTLQQNRAERALANAAATVSLMARGLDSQTFAELLHLQKAAWTRLAELQEGWVEDWYGWLQYSDQAKGANTMSKLVERECNSVAQAVQLMGAQATSLVGLQENIEVDYSYWVNEKLKEQHKPLLLPSA